MIVTDAAFNMSQKEAKYTSFSQHRGTDADPTLMFSPERRFLSQKAQLGLSVGTSPWAAMLVPTFHPDAGLNAAPIAAWVPRSRPAQSARRGENGAWRTAASAACAVATWRSQRREEGLAGMVLLTYRWELAKWLVTLVITHLR